MRYEHQYMGLRTLVKLSSGPPPFNDTLEIRLKSAACGPMFDSTIPGNSETRKQFTSKQEDIMATKTDGTGRGDGARGFSRRELLKRAGLVGAAVAFPVPALIPETALEQTREPFETLTAAESDTLEAIVARVIPTDENGGGPPRPARLTISTARLPDPSRLHAPRTQRVSRRSTPTPGPRKAHRSESYRPRTRMQS